LIFKGLRDRGGVDFTGRLCYAPAAPAGPEIPPLVIQMQKNENEFRGLFGVIVRRAGLIVAAGLLLSAVSVVLTSKRMEFLTGRDDLMPKNAPFSRDYYSYRQEFGDPEDIVVVIEGDDAERNTAFGERLMAAFSRRPDVVKEPFFPSGMPFFRNNGLLFMSLDEIRGLRQNLTLAKPVLKALSAAPSVETLFTTLTSDINVYLAEPKESPEAQRRVAGLTFMLGALDKGFSKFGGNGMPALSLEEFFFRGKGGEESAMTRAGRMQVLTFLPVKNAGSFKPAEAAISLARTEIAKLSALPEFKGVKAGLTGTPVLENEEMATSEHDITIATVLSLVLTVVLLLAVFRGILNVVAAMVSLLVAVCVSFGFATVAVGHLNILSMVFAIMLIGIGIEYGIQVVLRYQEERALGRPQLYAVERGLKQNVWPIVMAAATVAAAFLTFVFTDFKGVAELGIIAGGGIAVCVLATFTVLPAMLVIFARFRVKAPPNRFVPPEEKGKKKRVPPRLVSFLYDRPKAVLVATLLVCLAAAWPVSRVRFDYNLMNLQAKGLSSVEYAYKLMRSKENSGYFAAVSASSPAEAAALTKRLEALPAVDHVVSLLSFVPEDQATKLTELAALRQELSDIVPKRYEEELNVMALPTVFENFRTAVEKLKVRLEGDKAPQGPEVAKFMATLDKFFSSLEKEKDRNALGMLREFQGGLFATLPEKIGMLKESLNAHPVVAADVPQELRKRFVGKTGKYQLQVAPKKEIFDREPLQEFIGQVRSVAPHATGEPVMVYESMTIMRDAYLQAFLYALGAIVVILLVTFRSLLYTAIGLIPLLVGILFMAAAMNLCGIDFNSANIIIMPLVLGIAVDSGIYIINRFRRENETPAQVIASSTGVGVICNTLTIMASFGALIVAHHRGVFSIGAAMSLGMVACQVAFIVVLPAVLSLVRRR
jgi:uncharacterized protein